MVSVIIIYLIQTSKVTTKPELTHEGKDHLNRTITRKNIASEVKVCFSLKTTLGLDDAKMGLL